MIQRLFSFVSALSLILCIGAVWLWVSSYHREVRLLSLLQFPDRPGMTQLDVITVALRGGVLVKVRRDTADTEAGAGRLRANRMCRPLWMAKIRSIAEVDAYRVPGRPPESYIHSPTRPARLGFQIGQGRGSYSGITWTESRFSIPFWCLACVTALLPCARAAAGIRSVKRRRTGHCWQCGYDLRASKDRCPECGTPIPQMAEVPA